MVSLGMEWEGDEVREPTEKAAEDAESWDYGHLRVCVASGWLEFLASKWRCVLFAE